MGLSHDIRLDHDKTPLWPEVCPGCLDPVECGVKLYSWYSGLWSLIAPILMLFQTPAVRRVPVCRPCRTRVVMSRWWRRLITWGVIIAALIYVAPWVREWDLPRSVARWATIGVVAAVVFPTLLVQVVFPPIVDLNLEDLNLQGRGKKLRYEFKNLEYARQFVALNDAKFAT